ncbi:tRNA pseudouridine(38/39) synthase-like [Scleropages formosus]|uniref:Pseudouridylate synthase 3 n=1 Tax=Scleropages formosus TaxID=113540 RepID=A0A0P7T7F2_SCLFO|nr:tRNA pseudouridine(38/39) synthase [Scleropages formosus]KPP56802.1 tRNA pseudouridine(38/39) synthase-like [Scleropages formosus]
MSESLQEQLRGLEEEVKRLKALLKEKEWVDEKEMEPESEPGGKNIQADEGKKKGKKGGQTRAFDFSAHPRRHVALRLAYLGWDYQGFAVQENTDNTVEARLFEALLKTRLIQDRQTSNYHRCGRTDKGVSAFSQVITIDLRSTQFCGGLGVILPPNIDDKQKPNTAELPYTKILNRVLPPDIRVLDWAAVETGFSARFDCQSRTYRYYFPRGDLDVELMTEAAKRYEGTHDFRNLCKMDVGNGVLQFQRTILSASIQAAQLQKTASSDSYDLFFFEVKGLAFLYHQVRCMMAVLFMIGQKLEKPDVIDQLLDVEKNPRKPQYSMAMDYPLVLYDCHFEGLSWQREAEEVDRVLATLQQHWTLSAVKSQILQGMIQGLQSSEEKSSSHPCWLLEGTKQRNYRPLLERPCCESLESRIEHFVKRGRLEREKDEDGEEFVHRGKRAKCQEKSCHQSSVTNISDL